MGKYKYKVVVMATPAAMNIKKMEEISQQIEDELNGLGIDGWEFVQWKGSMMIFKQEIS